MPVINSIAALKDEAAAWRRALHQNPQTSYQEEFAAAFISKKLTEWGIPHRKGIAVTGVVATITGQKTSSGKSVGLRADIDALDITEKTLLPHASKIPGKMHACGHDGHTATLLAAAKYLNDTKNFNGTVHLIFQPAEEGDKGAHRMISEGLFKDFPCDFVFGLHNWPGIPVGKAATRVGPLMAAVDEFDITITGVGGHAAMPHMTVDPGVVAAHVVLALQTIVSRNVDPVDTAVLSVTNINIGTGAHNVIGDTATLNGTVRTFSQSARKLIQKRMKEVLDGVCAAMGAKVSMNYQEMLDPTVNTADGVEIASQAIVSVVGEKNFDPDTAPCMGGEDFGAFLMERPGAYIFVGQGTADKNSPHNQGLHSPFYDFNDEIIPIGASFFAQVVEQHLKL